MDRTRIEKILDTLRREYNAYVEQSQTAHDVSDRNRAKIFARRTARDIREMEEQLKKCIV